ncbi:Rieske (2Fe-2S) protein [Planosporangium sp. 12N6]|uniref:Rieske (2Fe-2S) protein n=1 Tax=Planosporangium spinosum TaxID=3402278 RepID=UPI003CEA1916
MDRQVSRREVLLGSAALGGLSLAGMTLSGCSRYSPPPNGAPGGDEQGDRTPAPGQGGEGILDTTDHIPVGGGRVYPPHQVVVTQPAAGDFKCFRAVCPHAGCLVNKVADGAIDCPCHGSRFSITNGAAIQGPATKPLEPRAITVDIDQVRLLD